MYNGGSVSVIYDVDLSPLKQLEQDNFNHPVLTCLNPSGEIIPGTNGSLEWVFSPLESKTYEVCMGVLFYFYFALWFLVSPHI